MPAVEFSLDRVCTALSVLIFCQPQRVHTEDRADARGEEMLGMALRMALGDFSLKVSVSIP